MNLQQTITEIRERTPVEKRSEYFTKSGNLRSELRTPFNRARFYDDDLIVSPKNIIDAENISKVCELFDIDNFRYKDGGFQFTSNNDYETLKQLKY